MRVLFDQGTPVPIRPFLISHTVRTAAQHHWDTLKNGDLLVAAEDAGFDVFVTTDRNIPYQQNLAAGPSRSLSSASSNGLPLNRTSRSSSPRWMGRRPAATLKLRYHLVDSPPIPIRAMGVTVPVGLELT
jgi:hypothetical protein